MKSLTLLSLLLIGKVVFAQLPTKVKPTNDRDRYMCGLTKGVIDCAEKLTFNTSGTFARNKITGKPFSGKCESCHNNGIIDSKFTYVDGWITDTAVSYYPSGNIRFAFPYTYGKKNGIWRSYYDSVIPGEMGAEDVHLLSIEVGFMEDVNHGKKITYEIDGSKIKEENYNFGVLHGKAITYFPLEEGQTPDEQKEQKIAEYSNGVLSGEFKVFYAPDTLALKQQYEAVKRKKTFYPVKNGEFVTYYPNGKEKQVEHYSMDKKNGEFIWYFQDGNIEKVEYYYNDKPDGTWKTFYTMDKFDKTPKLHTETIYKKGKKLSSTEWDRFGEIVSEDGETVTKEEEKIGEDGKVINTEKEKKKKAKEEKKKKK